MASTFLFVPACSTESSESSQDITEEFQLRLSTSEVQAVSVGAQRSLTLTVTNTLDVALAPGGLLSVGADKGTVTVNEALSTCSTNVYLGVGDSCTYSLVYTAVTAALPATITATYKPGWGASETVTIPINVFNNFYAIPQDSAGYTELPSNTVHGVHAENGIVYVGTPAGMAISSNVSAGGSTWTSKTTASALNAYGASGMGDNSTKGVFVKNGKFYAATLGGLAFSEDGGKTWSNLTQNTSYFSENLPEIYDVFVDDQENIYLATGSNGVAVSKDAGQTWTLHCTGSSRCTGASGFPNNFVHTVHVDSGNIYAGTNGGLAILKSGASSWETPLSGDFRAVEALNGVVFAGCANSCPLGVQVSVNNGATWKKITDIPSQEIYDIVMEGSNVYVATLDQGLFVSTNNGVSWKLKNASNSGLASNNVSVLDVENGVVYLGTHDEGLSIWNTADDSWISVRASAGTRFGASAHYGLVVDNRIYAIGSYGLWISQDNGVTWQAQMRGEGNLPNAALWGVAEAQGTIYVASVSDGVAFSPDFGKSWVKQTVGNNSGLGFDDNASIAADDAGRVLVGTLEGGPMSLSTNGGQSYKPLPYAIDGSTPQRSESVLILGDFLYAGSSTGLYQLQNQSTWSKISGGCTNDVGIQHLRAVGTQVYLATNSGLALLADPENPSSVVCKYSSAQVFYSIDVSGDIIYVAEGSTGIRMLNRYTYANLGTLTPVAHGLPTADTITYIQATDDRLYVMGGGNVVVKDL